MIAKAKTTSKRKNTAEDDIETKGEDDDKAKKEMEEMTNMLKENLDLHAEMGGDNTEFEGLVAKAMKGVEFASMVRGRELRNIEVGRTAKRGRDSREQE